MTPSDSSEGAAVMADDPTVRLWVSLGKQRHFLGTAPRSLAEKHIARMSLFEPNEFEIEEVVEP